MSVYGCVVGNNVLLHNVLVEVSLGICIKCNVMYVNREMLISSF